MSYGPICICHDQMLFKSKSMTEPFNCCRNVFVSYCWNYPGSVLLHRGVLIVIANVRQCFLLHFLFGLCFQDFLHSQLTLFSILDCLKSDIQNLFDFRFSTVGISPFLMGLIHCYAKFIFWVYKSLLSQNPQLLQAKNYNISNKSTHSNLSLCFSRPWFCLLTLCYFSTKYSGTN